MNDNIVSLDKHRQDKAHACMAAVTLSTKEATARAAAAAQAAVEQEARSQMHMILINATARVLDVRPLSTEDRIEIACSVVRAIMGHGWKVVRK